MADKNRKKKKKKWIHPRHRFVFGLFRVVGAPIVRWMYKIDAEPFKEQGDRAYLILMNHQTPYDQFFVAMSIKVIGFDLLSSFLISLYLSKASLTVSFSSKVICSSSVLKVV